MPYRIMDDTGYHAMVRESVPWALANGVLADCSNLIFDNTGIARLRMGSVALVSGAQTAAPTSMGWVYSQDATAIEELYGLDGKTGNIISINKTTGAFTTISPGTIPGRIAGRPCMHFGYVIFPMYSPRVGWFAAGQTSSTLFTTATAANLVALSPTITLGGADTTTNLRVGGVVSAGGAANLYYGRVISIDSATTFSVWPTPKITFATIAGQLSAASTGTMFGGTCVTSFQGRLLFGNTVDLGSSGTPPVTDRRVYYSPLATETFTNTAGTVTYDGAGFTLQFAWPVKNFFEVPGADPIVAMEPVNDGELIILTNSRVIVFRGTLATQTSTNASGVTWDLSPLPIVAGCLSDLSVQRTPAGIMWVGTDGIYSYWPPLRRSPGHTGLHELTEGKIHTFWRDLTRGANFAIHGSAYVRNHYIVSLSSGGVTYSIAYNLTNQSFTLLTGVGTDIFLGTLRPTDPSQVFGLRWYDQTGAAPSMTNGQTLRLEQMFSKYVAGATTRDADGSVINFSATSRSITDDAMTPRIARRIGVRYQAAMAGANIQVQGSSRYDSADVVGTPLTTLGNLSNTAVLALSGQSNATPIVVTTTTNHGLQTGDFVDLHGVVTNTAANGRWQITVLSNTTFSLNQSKGNGATGATGTVKKFTEHEFECSGMDIGPSTYVKLASTGTVDNFELHGLRVGALEIPHAMGR